MNALTSPFGKVSMKAGEPTQVYDVVWIRPCGAECGYSCEWQRMQQCLSVGMDVRLKGNRGVSCQNIVGDADPGTRGCLGTCHP